MSYLLYCIDALIPQGNIMDIKDELLADFKPYIASQLLKHFDLVEAFVLSEAKKTATPFDDFLAVKLLSWAKGWLTEQAA